jgi:hypothetical protein
MNSIRIFLASFCLFGCQERSNNEIAQAENTAGSGTQFSCPLSEKQWEETKSLGNFFSWKSWLKDNCKAFYTTSDRKIVDAHPWPADHLPQNSKVFAHNEIVFPNISPEAVFDIMIQPQGWNSFYPNSGEAFVEDRGGNRTPVTTLSKNLKYTWKTFSTKQNVEVMEFQRGATESFLAWFAASPGTDAYHRWIFRKEGENTRVITEEVQSGFTVLIDFLMMNPALHASHQLWIEGLVRSRLSH